MRLLDARACRVVLTCLSLPVCFANVVEVPPTTGARAGEEVAGAGVCGGTLLRRVPLVHVVGELAVAAFKLFRWPVAAVACRRCLLVVAVACSSWLLRLVIVASSCPHVFRLGVGSPCLLWMPAAGTFYMCCVVSVCNFLSLQVCLHFLFAFLLTRMSFVPCVCFRIPVLFCFHSSESD